MRLGSSQQTFISLAASKLLYRRFCIVEPRKVPTVAPKNLRAVDRPHCFVMHSRKESHPVALHGRSSGVSRNVADRRRRYREQGYACYPSHLEEGVDRSVEGDGDLKQPLGGRTRDDLSDSPERRCVRSQQLMTVAAGDDRSRRLEPRRRDERVIPSQALRRREFEKGGEQGEIDRGVVLEHKGEVEIVGDDAPPGLAMAEERADLRQAQREGIARRKSRPHISLLNGFGGEQLAVDRRQDLAFDREPFAQGLDACLAARSALEMDDERLGPAQDWPFP